MENTILITQDLKDANKGKLDNYEIGQLAKIDDPTISDNDCTGDCAGNWVKIGGNCICNPAP